MIVVVEPGVVPEAWLRQLSRGTEGRLKKRRWEIWQNLQWKKSQSLIQAN